MDICISLGFSSTKSRAFCDKFTEERETKLQGGCASSCSPKAAPAGSCSHPITHGSRRAASTWQRLHTLSVAKFIYTGAAEIVPSITCTRDEVKLRVQLPFSPFLLVKSYPLNRSCLKGGFVWVLFFFFFFLPWNIWLNHIWRYFKCFIHVTPELYLLLK